MWFKKKKPIEEKLNPSQSLIGLREGNSVQSIEPTTLYTKYYEDMEIVNRGVNMIVDDASDMSTELGAQLPNAIRKGVRKVTVQRLLSCDPNPFQDISSFRRNLIIDLIIDGNIFVYFDGVHLYHLPASRVTIETDEKTYVKGYSYEGIISYAPNEIIHIKENSFRSIYRGTSRLKPAASSMRLLEQMRKFQHNFFKNGAVPGLVLKSPDVLSDKIKDRMLESWKLRYRPDAGGRSPLILDGGLEIDSVSNVNFKELDFQAACTVSEKTILKALGIPPVLFDGGNNANIAPNHRLYYLETVLPIVRKINTAFSKYFGYVVREDATDTPALQPALRDQAGYFSTLVNGGIITPNEARVMLGRDELEGHSDIRVPVNIAGSAVDPSQGGRPEEEED